jgi:DHA2 family multidrug resistance protein
VFYLLTVLFASLALFVMLIRKPPESASGGGGGH